MMKNRLQIATLACCLLVLLNVFLQNEKLEDMQRQTNISLNNLQSQLSEEISHYNRLQEEAQRLIGDYQLKFSGVDKEKQQLKYKISLSLKEWRPDTACTLLLQYAGRPETALPLTAEGNGSFSANLAFDLPPQSGDNIRLCARITNGEENRREEIAYTDLNYLLPIYCGGTDTDNPIVENGSASGRHIGIWLGTHDDQTLKISDTQFILYKNGQKAQTYTARQEIPPGDAPNQIYKDAYYRLGSSEDESWRIECSEADIIELSFYCRDEFGLAYEFCLMQLGPNYELSAPADIPKVFIP